MPNIGFDVDIANAFKAMRAAPPEVKKMLRQELVGMAKATVQEARNNMHSGMKSKGAGGFRWGYWGSKGAWMEAQGTSGVDATKGPKSWAAASEGGPSGQQGFRHPVFPKEGTPREDWNWGPGKSGRQAPKHPLHSAIEKNSVTMIPATEKAIQAALDLAFNE